MVSLNPGFSVTIQSLGDEAQPLVILDDVLADPRSFIAVAAEAGFRTPAPGSRYPGLNAPLPEAYKALVARELLPRLLPVFGAPLQALPLFGFFGVATPGGEGMAVRQAAPHIDAFNLNSFASVHYLFEADLGGTAFFRHRASGHELITPSRSYAFEKAKRAELDGFDGTGEAARERFFEQIAAVEPRFNRLIFYRAGQLHSGQVRPGEDRRLTANLFFGIR
ncbi:DUF6445 family protein [Asticcacaulis sp. AND118]|uniref:DUF6445 family protein n=1 Tax=Asticcacaulis sp. AND118 TaxID=2840468 RepID=UPI001CFFA7A8|nr:DUF6445 family protein [Asticcacaulis sp. AND118]UDF05506.1 DUF6445 family protein [Asticcacaulis sp. AND118]